jgi:hypothetical protein
LGSWVIGSPGWGLPASQAGHLPESMDSAIGWKTP